MTVVGKGDVFRHKRRAGATLAERLWQKVAKGGIDDCWAWTGATDDEGYGSICRDGKSLKAHRVMWELHYGSPPPVHLLVCHACDNPNCVNPAHLFLGTMSDNIRDCVAKGRHVNPQKLRTHCINGHPYSAENTYISKYHNRRCCRTCARLSKRRQYERKQAQPALAQQDAPNREGGNG